MPQPTITHRFRKVNQYRDHSYWATLCHLIFTATSGWCWRHSATDLEAQLKEVTHEDAPAFTISTGTFVFHTLHGLLGILRFGHPQLCMNGGFRKIYGVSFSLLRVLPCVLMSTEIYGFYWNRLGHGDLQHLSGSILFRYNLNYFLYGCLLVTICNELWKSVNWIKMVIVVPNILLLIMLGLLDESYWTVFLGVQVVFCNFLSDYVSRRFEISFLELFLIGMCFFNVFAYRALGESIEVLLEDRYNNMSS